MVPSEWENTKSAEPDDWEILVIARSLFNQFPGDKPDMVVYAITTSAVSVRDDFVSGSKRNCSSPVLAGRSALAAEFGIISSISHQQIDRASVERSQPSQRIKLKSATWQSSCRIARVFAAR